MAIERLEHVGIVVDDLEAAIEFFVTLGLEIDGTATVGGGWVDRAIGLERVRARIAMLRTPDGHRCVELSQFEAPAAPAEAFAEAVPANAPGLRHLSFSVDDLQAALDRLRLHGGELVGTVERYSDIYLLCYVRGPAGIIVELAQRLS